MISCWGGRTRTCYRAQPTLAWEGTENRAELPNTEPGSMESQDHHWLMDLPQGSKIFVSKQKVTARERERKRERGKKREKERKTKRKPEFEMCFVFF